MILHKNHDSNVQEMIIVLLKDSKIGIHKHPIGKPESYHVIEGILKVKIYDEKGKIENEIILEKNKNSFLHNPGDIWHEPEAISDVVIYHEVYTGPFEKNLDVVYLLD